MASDDSPELLEFGDAIDPGTFEQILEMDDDDDREFSRGIVYGFFEQADTTFCEMRDSLKSKDLDKLSKLGHFLKGSSATLGMTKVKDGCEKIQHYGAKMNDAGESVGGSDEEFLRKIENTIGVVENDYKDAQKRLKKFYGVYDDPSP